MALFLKGCKFGLELRQDGDVEKNIIANRLISILRLIYSNCIN